jgi:hypothetical protein
MTDTQIEYVRQGRPPGAKNKRTKELLDRLAARGDLDPADFLSSIVSNPEESKDDRIRASGLLLSIMHPKMQSTPVPLYIECPIPIPDFHTISEAADYLRRLLHCGISIRPMSALGHPRPRCS